MPPDPEMSRWRRRVFFATWLSYAAYYFCRKPFFIVKADLGDAMGWDPARLGDIGVAYLLAYAVGQFVAGALGDKLGPRVLLGVGMAVSAAANLAFGFTNSWGVFAAFMVLNGLAQATGWAGGVGSMAPWFRRKERGTVMGFWATNYQVGGVLSNLVAAWVAGAMGFRWSFFVGSVVLVLAWAVVLLWQRNRPEDVGLEPLGDDGTLAQAEAEGPDTGWTRDVIVNVALVGVFYFFVKFIRYAIWSWTPYLLNKSYGLASDDAGYLSTIFDLAGIAGVLACGWASDRFFGGRRAKIAMYFIVGMAVACVLMYVLGPTSLILFGVSLGLVGFLLYGPDALLTGAGAIEVGSRKRATLTAGIVNGLGQLGAVVQEFGLSRVMDRGVGVVFAALLASSLLAAVCLGLLLLRNKSGKADL